MTMSPCSMNRAAPRTTAGVPMPDAAERSRHMMPGHTTAARKFRQPGMARLTKLTPRCPGATSVMSQAIGSGCGSVPIPATRMAPVSVAETARQRGRGGAPHGEGPHQRSPDGVGQSSPDARPRSGTAIRLLAVIGPAIRFLADAFPGGHPVPGRRQESRLRQTHSDGQTRQGGAEPVRGVRPCLVSRRNCVRMGTLETARSSIS